MNKRLIFGFLSWPPMKVLRSEMRAISVFRKARTPAARTSARQGGERVIGLTGLHMGGALK